MSVNLRQVRRSVRKPILFLQRRRVMLRCALYGVILFCVHAIALSAAGEDETLLLRQPTISADHVAFVYAGDIWIADRDGGSARRLTVHRGVERYPMFSPDGSLIAFSGNYDGNVDVYVVSVEGGSPKRLTFHPCSDWFGGGRPTASGSCSTPRGFLSQPGMAGSAPCPWRAAFRNHSQCRWLNAGPILPTERGSPIR